MDICEYFRSSVLAHEGRTLDFYAYAPYNHPSITTKTFDKANGLTLEYTVPAEEAKQGI